MSDLISRQAAIKLIMSGMVGYDSLVECPEECNSMLVWAADEVAKMPTAEKVKRGRWVKLDMHPHLADHKCTACGESAYVPTCMGEPMYLFCPNCGALMREDGGEG